MLLKIRSIMSKSLTIVAALTLLGSSILPVTTFANEASDACVAPESTSAGVRVPTGSDAGTYTYNCATGLWENAHYTYDPATQQKTPKEAPVYTYNAATGLWDYLVWNYSPAKADFYQSTLSVAQPPAGATKIGGPQPAASAPAASATSNTGAGSTNTTNSNGGTPGSISNTGADSTNGIDTSGTNTTDINNNTNLNMNNTVTGVALSGDALVVGNTKAGNATSGDAQSSATVVNMLQSSSNALGSGSNVTTFEYDIDGDVYGDLFFDPNMMQNVQNASSNTDLNNNLTVNNSVDADINNNINLVAQSGDATVDANTQAGDATTGNARAIANVVNLINSAITSGQSFIGTININGNLNGDILLPPNFIDQLIASNVPTVNVAVPNPNATTATSSTGSGPGSTNTSDTTLSNSTTINNTNDLGITNNVTSNAASGNANVDANTKAGGATSGNATTTVTAFNLTGSQIIGRNSMLVFVNVKGSWVGLIVNAPAGATAAQLGGGITQNTALNGNTEINNTNDFDINNNITVDAQSGDANVTRNTNGGNAKTGNADTVVNLTNIQNSAMAFSDWFGILFINVFGNWNGSFGVDTEAGETPAVAGGGKGGNTTTVPGPTSATISSPVQVFRFVANTATAETARSTVSLSDYEAVVDTTAAAAQANQSNGGSVLSAETAKQPANTQQAREASNLVRTASIIGGLVLLFIALDAINTYRRRKIA